MDQLRFEEGVRYAEKNYRNAEGHLWLDKQFFQNHLSLDGKEVLDFGCGMGGMSLWCATRWNCQVRGVDIDANHLAIAQQVKKDNSITNVTFEQRNIVTDPLDQKFDVIILNDVIEHVPLLILPSVLDELARSLRKGGALFVSYPPWEGPYASHLNHIIKTPWCQFLPPRWLHRQIVTNNRALVGEKDLQEEYYTLNHLTHRRLVPLLEQAGLMISDRRSHTLINRVPGLKKVNLHSFPFTYLVTKELLLLRASATS